MAIKKKALMEFKKRVLEQHIQKKGTRSEWCAVQGRNNERSVLPRVPEKKQRSRSMKWRMAS